MENVEQLIGQLTAPLTAQEKFVQRLKKDNVHVSNEVVDMSKLINLPTRRGLEQGIISNGKLVNVVSNQYGHLPNDLFFNVAEEKLQQANINYAVQSINREDRSFSVDYILHDSNFVIKIKKGNDIIMPMIRLTNSYDGSNKTSGHFGFYRQVCSNGLHVAQSNINFSLKHRGAIVELVMPEINTLIQKFMDNEYYTLSRKFEVLAERSIDNVNDFVKMTAEQTKLFKYEASDKNPEPSANARFVIDIINSEARILGQTPNLWLGYNAVNQLIHDKLKKTFEAQKNTDEKIFEAVLSYQ